jgi:prepilin-type N-terminal cleavage/methylation domain-containing protein/prepilin-type processing-associated H-X9-DG protein
MGYLSGKVARQGVFTSKNDNSKDAICHLSRRSFLHGFTLIELLVVIAIIALLLSIMMPSLQKVKALAKKIVCGSNERNIMLAMQVYRHDSEGAFFPSQNGPRWYNLGAGSGRTGELLTGTEENPTTRLLAYWGTAYVDYGATRELFECPAKKAYEDNEYADEPGDEEAFRYSDYGLNGYICWPPPKERHGNIYNPSKKRKKANVFRRPSETIVLHDQWENTLDDNGDMYYINPNYSATENLMQMRQWSISMPYRAASLEECWRHDGSSNILWLDGHVSNLKETMGEDVKYVWYTGGSGGLR